MIESKNAFTPEELAKLPKWAQEKATGLMRERDTAVRNLREWSDTQTPQPFSIMEYVSTGEEQGPSRVVRYIEGHRIGVKWAGIELEVSIHDGSRQHDNGIRVQWSGINHSGYHIAMIPESFQTISLLSPENLRKA